MRQAFWDRRDDAPPTYERPYLQLPNPMHYRPQPQDRDEERTDNDIDDGEGSSRVIIIDM